MSGIAVSVDVTAVPAKPAGAGRYVVDLVAALAARDDVELLLIARTDDEQRWRDLAPGSDVRAVAPVRRPLRLAWEQVTLPRLIDHAAAACHLAPHYTMPERASTPTVVTIHDLTFFDNPEWHERAKVPVFRRAIRVAARHADGLVCVSDATARRLRQLLSPAGKIWVIPHGVDHARFHPRVEPTDAAAVARLGISPPFVLFVGTLEPRKDVPTLVRAFDHLAARHDTLSLVLAGGAGWGADAVAAAVAGARYRDRVRLVGYVADEALPALLRGAAVVAYPSLAEGFGLPALEALACGAPLVTSAGTAMAEVAGDAAVLFPAGDATSLASALEAAMADAPDAARRGDAGIKRAAAHTWEDAAAAHVEVFRAVSAHRSAR